MKTPLIVVASAAALFAQNIGRSTDKAKNELGAPDIRHIMELSIAATERNWQARMLSPFRGRSPRATHS